MSRMPRTRRDGPFARLSGLPRHFKRTTGGFLYRRDGEGPAVRVSEDERDAFVADAGRAAGWHLAALALCAAAAWLLADRLLADAGPVATAAGFAVLLSIAAAALHLSLEFHARAPAQALADRPIVSDARAPDMGRHPGYGAILGGVLMLLFLVGLGTGRPASFYVAAAVFVVMGGLYLALRRLFFDAGLTPAQRVAVRRAERHQPQPGPLTATVPAALLLIAFMILEMILLVAGVLLGVGLASHLAGMPVERLDWLPLGAGLAGGFALGLLAIRPVDRLCLRLTGGSASEALNSLPPSW